MPGHYVRLYEIKFEGKPPLPEVHWPDQEPLAIEGTLPEKLNTWLTLVQRGEVINAYRVFLGLWEEAVADPDRRTALLAQLVFAGLIDVQDRMLHNRSYTTGHKSYRARATVAARAAGRLGERARACSTRACPTSRWARAGTRPTRWAASSCRTSSTAATGSCSSNDGALTPGRVDGPAGRAR